MSGSHEELNRAIAEGAPALARALSPLGRRAAYPPDIPFQAAQASGTRYNATIGQITDGHGRVLSIAAVDSALRCLDPEDRNRALLYSPIEGHAELRRRWRDWQRPAGAPASSLPLVTVGLTHGLSLVADLFTGPGRSVLVPAPFWGNYRQIFALRTGARLRAVPALREGRYAPEALELGLSELAADEPAVAILNLPSNPGGYSPLREERERLVASLLEAAEARPLVVVCDDAYAGLVYEQGVPTESIFWQLAGRSERLIPLKVDGSTKELVLFGGRVGFLTFPFAPDSPVSAALESKVKCLLRATVGSPVALSQMVLLRALREGGVKGQVEEVRRVLGERYRALRQALATSDPELLRPLPCNSGAFALVELPAGVDPESVRRHLLEAEDVGVVALGQSYLRIAFCSLAVEAVPELVRRVERGVAAVASGTRGVGGAGGVGKDGGAS